MQPTSRSERGFDRGGAQPGVDITSVVPTQFWFGDTVTVYGGGFTGATSVTVGGVAAAYQVVRDNTLTVTIPANASGSTITITSPAGVATNNSGTLTPTLTDDSFQGMYAFPCANGSLQTTVNVDRLSGMVVGETLAQNSSIFCPYTATVAVATGDSSGHTIGYSTMTSIKVPLGGTIHQWWPAFIPPAITQKTRTLAIVQTLDNQATLQGALDAAVSSGEFLSSLVGRLG